MAWGRLARMPFIGLVLAALLGVGELFAEDRFNLPVGVTPVSQEIYGLHMLILWVCAGIAVVVFGALGYAALRYRKSRGAVPQAFHEHRSLEIVWTVIPFLLLILMAIPATQTLMAMGDTSEADLTIRITGSQWKWQYEYLDSDIKFLSNLATPAAQRENRSPKGEHYLVEVDRPLVVPVGKKIRFLLTSSDVIHSWWVQELGVKMDAIPGFINEAWARVEQPGVYRGKCAELCGVGHGYMPVVVEARAAAEFAAWQTEQVAARAAEEAAAQQVLALAELSERGEKVYATNCAACHQATGIGLPGVFPALKGSQVVLGPVADHLAVVLNGRPGTAMPGFGQLNDLDLAAVVTYERNAWGNATGDTVQAADVKAARGHRGVAAQ